MRQARYSPAQELNRAYENAAPQYRLFVRHHDFATRTQLTQMAAEFEYEYENLNRTSHGPDGDDGDDIPNGGDRSNDGTRPVLPN
ncbi:hypothetical protein AWZ03_015141 [Drosophila navojoa]|uniref:Uncharacterized protein n=1 Tax=Drosophila navojoa TaxID=7232 RepID=A0A484AMZ1_DRONA|nr:hypothetical protein AWZ03_015141 [Drosophila navojoa]